MDDLFTMRDKILQSNNCTSNYQRMVMYLGLGMVLADSLIHQGDLVMGWRSCRCAQLSFRGRREEVRKSRRSTVTLHPGHVLQSGAGPAGHVPQQPQEGGNVGLVADLSLAWPLSLSAGGLPGQDDLLREEAGYGAGLLCHQQVELVTSAGAEIGKSVGMVLEVGDQAVQALGIEDRLD